MSNQDQLIARYTERIHELEEKNQSLQETIEMLLKRIHALESGDIQSNNESTNADSPPSAPIQVQETQRSRPRVQSAKKQSNLPSDWNGDPNSLVQAIEEDQVTYVQKAFNAGFPIDYFFHDRGSSKQYQGLLHEAVQSSAIKSLHFICSKAQEFNPVNINQETPLVINNQTLCAELGHHDAMCILLQQSRGRVDLEHINKSGMTAIQIAVRNGHKDIVALLVEHGADINVTNQLGDSLLKIAQRGKYQEIVMSLVNAGASLSGPNGLFFIELQKSYGKDPRFVLDERFIGDIDVSKLPKDIQANFQYEKAFVDDQNLGKEKEHQLQILAEVVPSSEKFIGNPSQRRLTRRFDPRSPDEKLIQQHKSAQPPAQSLPQKRRKTQEDSKIDQQFFRKQAPRRKVTPTIAINPNKIRPVQDFVLFK